MLGGRRWGLSWKWSMVVERDFFHVTRGVEGFDFQGSVVGEVGMSSSNEVLFEVVGVFEADGAVG